MMQTRYRGFVPAHRVFQQSMCNTLVSKTKSNPEAKLTKPELELFLNHMESKKPQTTESILSHALCPVTYRGLGDSAKIALATQLVHFMSNNPSYQFTAKGWVRA